MKPGTETTVNVDDAFEQAPVAKPTSVRQRKGGTRKQRWKSRSTRAKLSFATGDFIKFHGAKERVFDEMTVGELRHGFEELRDRMVEQLVPEQPAYVVPKGLPLRVRQPVTPCWMDLSENERKELGEKEQGEVFAGVCFEEEEDKPAEILGFSWRSEPVVYDNKRWVKVESVVDSGASAPVAPPSMLPNVKIRPSEGSKRGQKFTSASKHKLKNLGEQKAKAYTETGEPTEVLFQVADVSKPLVSVSAICERGNRVVFGKSGGVVQNLASGSQIPFYRRNGIYILSMWLQDADDEDFHRP